MEQAIGMPVVGCFKQVSIITSNNTFTPARFPSIGLVLSALPVIPIDVFFFLRRFPTVFSRNLSPGNGKARMEGVSKSRMYRSILASRPRRRVSGRMLVRTISGQYLAVAPLPGSFDH